MQDVMACLTGAIHGILIIHSREEATERQCGVIMNMIIHIHVRWSMQEPV